MKKSVYHQVGMGLGTAIIILTIAGLCAVLFLDQGRSAHGAEAQQSVPEYCKGLERWPTLAVLPPPDTCARKTELE
jgi:hypothetical protein